MAGGGWACEGSGQRAAGSGQRAASREAGEVVAPTVVVVMALASAVAVLVVGVEVVVRKERGRAGVGEGSGRQHTFGKDVTPALGEQFPDWEFHSLIGIFRHLLGDFNGDFILQRPR